MVATRPRATVTITPVLLLPDPPARALELAHVTKRQHHRVTPHRIEPGVDRGAQAAAGAREGVHPAARRAEPAAPRPALGARRQALRISDRPGTEDARRAVRRQAPARRLPFHVRARLY